MNKFFVILTLVSVTASKLPIDFKKCNVHDKSCLKDAIQDALPKLRDGIPELGVPSLDPMFIPKMSVGRSKSADFVQKYENVNVSGFFNTELKDFTLDLKRGKLLLDISLPEADMNGTYSIKGRLMIFEIFGNGESSIKMERIWGKFSMDLEKYTKNNQTYLRGSNETLTMDCEHVVFKFDNLFNGHKQMSDNIHKVVSDNWREFFDELHQGYADVFAAGLANIMNKLFSRIPVTELFLD